MRQLRATSAPTSARPATRHRLLAIGLPVVLAATLVSAVPARADTHGSQPGDPAVITTWNQVGLTTLLGDPTKVATESQLYLGFVNAAMYDAVVGVEGGYQPYAYRTRAPHGASAEAAAAAAAHHVLVTYSPYATAALDTALATSLAAVPDGPGETAGVAYGTAVAENLVALRANDGRNAPVSFTMPPAPGIWRPTPPALAPMAVPWMAYVKPLLVRDSTQFGDPGPPPAMTSKRYTRDFAEVKALGSASSTARTAEQTATAKFFSGNAMVQYVNGLRDQIETRHLDLVHAARLSAAVIMSIADAVISIWYAKITYGFWRPITAIQLADTDGNPATEPDPTWAPMINTPPYPDWASGYSSVTGAFSRAVGRALHTSDLDITLTSTAVPGEVRTFDRARDLNGDVLDARVWLGIHFRFSDNTGLRIGQRVADWALSHYFKHTDCDD